MLRLIKPFELKPLDQVASNVLEVCKKFEDKYKTKCFGDIVRNQRFHYHFYLNVFKGNELVSWLIKKRLVRTREQGEQLGQQLVEGRVIHHVSRKRNFYDSFNLYKFDNA
jgi:hypothetical protein